MNTISWEADFEYELFEPNRDVGKNETLQRESESTSSVTDNDVTGENKQSNTNEDEIMPRLANSCEGLVPADESPSSAEIENEVIANNEQGSDAAVKESRIPLLTGFINL